MGRKIHRCSDVGHHIGHHYFAWFEIRWCPGTCTCVPYQTASADPEGGT